MGKIRWIGLGVALLVLVGFGVFAAYLQAQLFVYHPPDQRQAMEKSPADYGLAYQDVTLTTADQYNLAAWYLPSANGAAIILLHGHKNDREDVLLYAEILSRNGYGVLMFDFRAHGASDGDVISFGQRETQDVEAAYQYLLTRADVDAGRIGILGVSMGGSIGILYAAENPGIQAVVADSTYASLGDQVQMAVALNGLPSFLLAPAVQWFAERKANFDSTTLAAVDHIGAISPRPVFLMQGGEDSVIMPDSAQRLYDVAGDPRELWLEPLIRHAMFAAARSEAVESRVVHGFLDLYLLADGQ